MDGKQLKSHDFPEVYRELGVDLNTLGCIMMDVHPILESDFDVKPSYLYYAKNKDHFWINGWNREAHLTLLYGLMEPGLAYKKYVDMVLADWNLKEVEIDHFGYFNSPMKDEDYYCIVAHIKVTPKVLEGHQRLEFLPHINTFAGYKPHVTVAYIVKDANVRDNIINDLNYKFAGKKLDTIGINYGGNK